MLGSRSIRHPRNDSKRHSHAISKGFIDPACWGSLNTQEQSSSEKSRVRVFRDIPHIMVPFSESSHTAGKSLVNQLTPRETQSTRGEFWQ